MTSSSHYLVSIQQADGRFDLEKVARAILDSGVLEAAFREGFSDGHLKAGEDRGRYDAPSEDEAWSIYRAQVLGEKP